MLMLLLAFFIALLIVFAVLSFAVHHLFLIGVIIAGLLVLGHGGFLARRRT